MNKEIKTKKCSKCNRILPISEFSKDKTRKDKLQYWCKECSNKYYKTNSQQHKEYYDRFKGYYLYIILDKQDKVVYVGETTNHYKRLCNHLSGYVNSTKELFASNEWGCIKYLDVSFVANEMELKSLENELIELYEPRLNTQLNIIRDIDRGRLFSLIATLHSMNQDWEIFKTNTN